MFFIENLIATNEETLEQNYLIVNTGRTLSSVDIYADETIADYVTFDPGITETPVQADENIRLKVFPNLTAMKNDNITKAEGNIVISSAGKQQKFSLTMDTQGKTINSVTMSRLIDYQNGNKEYYNVKVDTSNLSENISVKDNLSDGSGGDYSVSYSIPYVDKNTDTVVANETAQAKISVYHGNEPSGTIKKFEPKVEDNKITITQQVVVSKEDVSDVIRALQSKCAENYSTNGETRVNVNSSGSPSTKYNYFSDVESVKELQDNLFKTAEVIDTFFIEGGKALVEYVSEVKSDKGYVSEVLTAYRGGSFL